MAQPISSVGLKHCNNMSNCWFDTPSRSIFIIFQVECKGPKSKILIRVRQNPSSPFFIRHALYITYYFGYDKVLTNTRLLHYWRCTAWWCVVWWYVLLIIILLLWYCIFNPAAWWCIIDQLLLLILLMFLLLFIVVVWWSWSL